MFIAYTSVEHASAFDSDVSKFSCTIRFGGGALCAWVGIGVGSMSNLLPNASLILLLFWLPADHVVLGFNP